MYESYNASLSREWSHTHTHTHTHTRSVKGHSLSSAQTGASNPDCMTPPPLGLNWQNCVWCKSMLSRGTTTYSHSAGLSLKVILISDMYTVLQNYWTVSRKAPHTFVTSRFQQKRVCQNGLEIQFIQNTITKCTVQSTKKLTRKQAEVCYDQKQKTFQHRNFVQIAVTSRSLLALQLLPFKNSEWYDTLYFSSSKY